MATPTDKLDRKRILYVEDNPDSREILQILLKDHDLVTARTVRQGAALARLGGFDLFVLNNLYDDGTGVELCRKIRAFDNHTPILFFSAVADQEHIREAISAGAQEYLVKPNDITLLQKAVERLLKGNPPA
jgi:DNA-binding response OmpR family regulator